MKLVIGLGNPGRRFKNTRHNTGFLIVEHLADLLVDGGKWELVGELESEIFNFQFSVYNLVFVKPRTAMNASGTAVKKVVGHWGIELDNLLLIHDDLDLPFGGFKLQKGRGAAGHKGVESVIATLGSKGFWRLRVGIGRPPGEMTTEDYVLGNFSKGELRMLEKLVEKELVGVVKDWVGTS